MTYRARAPLRLGLAGGGTDTEPYCSEHGGLVVNAGISLYAHCTIRDRRHDDPPFRAHGIGTELLEAVHGFLCGEDSAWMEDKTISAYTDVPPRSGLGGSSALVVAILECFRYGAGHAWVRSTIAELAWEIERKQAGIPGGKQDQWAAAAGGIHSWAFGRDGTVMGRAIPVRKSVQYEMERSFVLCYVADRREGFAIIEDQSKRAGDGTSDATAALHEMKGEAVRLATALKGADMVLVANTLMAGWETKKRLSPLIMTPELETSYHAAIDAGATGGKITGAGGGGFMLFWCPGDTKDNVERALTGLGGTIYPFVFDFDGVRAWKTNS